MTRLTGCKQLYALVLGIAVAWNYAEKSVMLLTLMDFGKFSQFCSKKFYRQILIIAHVP